MTPTQLEDLLTSWGRAYGESRAIECDEDGFSRPPVAGYGRNGIAVAMEFAPGKRQTVIRQRTAQDRAGFARRRLMATELGLAGVRIVGAGYVDPIPCAETRPRFGAPRADRRVTEAVQAVQSAWLTLKRFDTLRADVVQAQYQRIGMVQADKAAFLGIALKRYRDELTSGRTWLHGRLAA